MSRALWQQGVGVEGSVWDHVWDRLNASWSGGGGVPRKAPRIAMMADPKRAPQAAAAQRIARHVPPGPGVDRQQEKDRSGLPHAVADHEEYGREKEAAGENGPDPGAGPNTLPASWPCSGIRIWLCGLQTCAPVWVVIVVSLMVIPGRGLAKAQPGAMHVGPKPRPGVCRDGKWCFRDHSPLSLACVV